MDRVILHVDVNNAFLSWSAVDMLKNGYKEDIRYKYAIIGGDESQRRGIVLAKSFPCKKKGVITGESIYSARRKCPYLEVYKPKPMTEGKRNRIQGLLQEYNIQFKVKTTVAYPAAAFIMFSLAASII